jgi:hypothetical protein
MSDPDAGMQSESLLATEDAVTYDPRGSENNESAGELMVRRRLTAALVAVLLAGVGVGAATAAAPPLRTCVNEYQSGFQIKATPNVSCSTAKRVEHAYAFQGDLTFRFDGFTCRSKQKVGAGGCVASRHRRITWNIP